MTTVNRIELPTPFALSRVNTYYLHDSNPALIDAGVDTDEAFEVLRSGVSRAGGTLEKIRRIILTHAHADHIGLVSRIVESSGAEVFIHRQDAPKMFDSGETGAALLRSKYREFLLESGTPEDLTEEFLAVLFKRLKRFFRCFEDVKPLNGTEVFLFDSFKLDTISTPGHSPGSMCMYNRDDGTLFSGDTLLEKITSNPVVEVNPSKENKGYRSLETYKSTLARLAELSVKTVMPGHGDPFFSYLKRVRQLLDHHEERTSQVMELLDANPACSDCQTGMTRYMITQELFRGLQGMDVFLGLSEIKGHLEILETRGMVMISEKDGKLFYRLKKAV